MVTSPDTQNRTALTLVTCSNVVATAFAPKHIRRVIHLYSPDIMTIAMEKNATLGRGFGFSKVKFRGLSNSSMIVVLVVLSRRRTGASGYAGLHSTVSVLL